MAPVISIEGLDDFGVVLSNLRPLQQASRAGTKALYDGRTACLTFQASPGFNCNAIVCLRLLSWSHPGDLDVEQRQGTSGPASTSESEREGRGERERERAEHTLHVETAAGNSPSHRPQGLLPPTR